MSTDLETLALRAVACRHWRWLVGMRALSPLGMSLVLTGHSIHDGEPVWREWADPEGIPFQAHLHTLIPDLRDRVTVAALLPLVRDAWHDPQAYACDYMGHDSVQWGVCSQMWLERREEDGPRPWFACLIGQGRTELEALVVALEDAP